MKFVIYFINVENRVRVMVFNNNSVIWCRSVLLVEETRVPEKTTDLSQVTENRFPYY